VSSCKHASNSQQQPAAANFKYTAGSRDAWAIQSCTFLCQRMLGSSSGPVFLAFDCGSCVSSTHHARVCTVHPLRNC
jgi:hypothetical protein